jgi:hypothetical protein
MGIYKQVAILIIHLVSCRSVTLLKFIYSSIQISNILVLIRCCKLINFVYQIFPLLIPEMSAGFSSYIVQIIPIYLEWIL